MLPQLQNARIVVSFAVGLIQVPDAKFTTARNTLRPFSIRKMNFESAKGKKLMRGSKLRKLIAPEAI